MADAWADNFIQGQTRSSNRVPGFVVNPSVRTGTRETLALPDELAEPNGTGTAL